MDEATRTLMMDSRLSTDARVLGMYVASLGPGAHEIMRERFELLLGNVVGRGRVQRALRQLIAFQWIDRAPGGQGHADRYGFRGLETRPLNEIGASKPGSYSDRGLEIEPLNPPHTRDYTRETTSSSPPTPRTRARKEDLDRLTAFLADHADAALLMDGSADHPKNWAAAVYGNFCREPSLDPILDRVPAPDKPGVVALALTRYAAEGGVYHGLHFRSYIERAARDRLNGAAEPSANGSENATAKDVPACTIEDVKALLEHGGSDLRMVATRGLAFGDLERGYPDLWARAGPTFVRFQAFDRLLSLLNKGDDYGLNQAIRDQLRRLRRDRAA